MSQQRQARHRISGFTLVEALVATLLMAMILAALATVTAQWLPGWNRGFVRLQRSELVAVALERLVADLAAAEFIPAHRRTERPLFDGTELSVTFVRSAIGPNTAGGLEVVRISESADRQGPFIVRATAPFAPNSGSIDHLYFGNPVVLLRAPYRLSFAYAGGDRVWRGAWHDAAQLPSAVRLTVRDAATDRALTVSTVATVHAELPAECAAAKDDDECPGSGRAKARAKPASDRDRDATVMR